MVLTNFDLGVISLRRKYRPSTKKIRKLENTGFSRSRRYLNSRSCQASKTYAYAYDLLARDSWILRNRQHSEKQVFSNLPISFSLRRNFA